MILPFSHRYGPVVEQVRVRQGVQTRRDVRVRAPFQRLLVIGHHVGPQHRLVVTNVDSEK